VVVTRNYGDFTDLAAAFTHAGREFPGVLFVSLEDSGPEQAERIARWLAEGGAEQSRNRCCWL